nr:hypothetical protein Iba_chr09fCG5060 [Ipomoea batatas]
MAQLGSSMNDFCEACAFGVRSSFRWLRRVNRRRPSPCSASPLFLTEDFICSFAPWYRNKIVTVLGLRSLICGAKKFPRTLVTRLTLLVDSYLNLLSGVTWIMQHRDSFGVSNFICWINEAVIEERWTVFRTYNCI